MKILKLRSVTVIIGAAGERIESKTEQRVDLTCRGQLAIEGKGQGTFSQLRGRNWFFPFRGRGLLGALRRHRFWSGRSTETRMPECRPSLVGAEFFRRLCQLAAITPEQPNGSNFTACLPSMVFDLYILIDDLIEIIYFK